MSKAKELLDKSREVIGAATVGFGMALAMVSLFISLALLAIVAIALLAVVGLCWVLAGVTALSGVAVTPGGIKSLVEALKEDS